MTKKFSIKKLVAGVLAAAMVVTALPVSGLTAKAAESDVWTVYRSYNPNDGEHLMTVDAAEHKFVVAQGRTDEGAAWTAPKTSKTPVYRVYNPNSGEHLLVPQGEAEGLAKIGWSNEGIKMYSDDEKGVPIYRVFNPNATDAGAHLYTSNQEEVKMLVAAGWSADNNGQPMLYGVGEDLSAEVTLVDKDGLQSNGTALTGDTLAIVFGSTFGVPKSVVWYKDGAVIGVKVDDIYSSDLAISPSEAGDYYAVVENTNGKSYKTNTLTVVEEGTAVISAVSINDNYEALAKFAANPTNPVNRRYALFAPDADTETGLAVVNVKFNKFYDGVFYLVAADVEKYADIEADDQFVPDEDNTVVVTKKTDFTDEKLATAAIATSTTGTQIQALCLSNKDGSVEYKILSDLGTGNTIKRGKDYKVIYDQDNSVTTNSTIKDWNVSEATTCPYLYKPTKVEVTDPQSNTDIGGWTLTAYMGDTKAGWLHSTNNSKVTSKLYTNTSSSTEDGEAFAPQLSRTIFGVGCTAMDGSSNAHGGSDLSYVYGTLTIAKGIVDEKEFTLTSAVCATPDKIAELATVAPASSDAKDMEVTISKLRADATIYLVGGDANGDTFVNDFDASDDNTFIASANLKKGTTSYKFEDAVEKFANEADPDGAGDNYYVIIVPKDATSYARYESAAKNIVQSVSSYKVSGVTKKQKADGAASEAVLEFYDQYGTQMDASVINKAMSLTKVTDDSDDVTMQFETDGDGVITLTQAAGDAAVGDKFTYKILSSQTITATCTTAGDENDSEWTITVE